MFRVIVILVKYLLLCRCTVVCRTRVCIWYIKLEFTGSLRYLQSTAGIRSGQAPTCCLRSTATEQQLRFCGTRTREPDHDTPPHCGYFGVGIDYLLGCAPASDDEAPTAYSLPQLLTSDAFCWSRPRITTQAQNQIEIDDRREAGHFSHHQPTAA